MAVQETGRSTGFVKDLKRQVVLAGMKAISPIVDIGTENILHNITTEFEPGAKDKLKTEAKKGKRFLVVPNHQCLADPLATMDGTDQMAEIAGIPGYFLPYTMTVETGDKGADIKGLQDVLSGKLPEHRIRRILLSRASDQANFGTRSNLREVQDQITAYLKDGFSGIIFAEGCLNAPRPKGVMEQIHKQPLDIATGIFQSERARLAIQRNGMQHFQRNALRSILETAEDEGIEIDVVPVRMSRTYNIYDEVTRTISRSALRVGLHLSDYSLAKVTFLNPISVNEGVLGEIRRRHTHMTKQDWTDFNSVIEQKIAGGLPRKMQGVYAS